MRVLMRPAAAILLLAAGVLLAPAANAQVQSPPGLSEQTPNISDQKLDAAAAAIESAHVASKAYSEIPNHGAAFAHPSPERPIFALAAG